MTRTNPFVYGSVVTGKNYLPRLSLERRLKDNIKSGQNTAIQGDRRVGKTSLVHNVATAQKGRTLLFVDFLRCSDLFEVAAKIVESTLSASPKRSFLDAAMKAMGALRPTMSFDGVSGTPTFSVGLDRSTSNDPATIGKAIDGIHELSKKVKLVVLFDEFQTLLKIDPAQKALAAMRSRIQFQSDVCYIFSGSDRTRILQIFTDPNSPFYKSAEAMSVEPIAIDPFWGFISNKFKEGRIKMDPSFKEHTTSRGFRTPGDIQQICSFAWTRAITENRKSIDDKDANQSILDIVEAESIPYQDLIEPLAPSQKKLLYAIARAGGQSIYSQDFMRASGLTSSSAITKAASQLQKYGLLKKRDQEWFITNTFFRQWLSVP